MSEKLKGGETTYQGHLGLAEGAKARKMFIKQEPLQVYTPVQGNPAQVLSQSRF